MQQYRQRGQTQKLQEYKTKNNFFGNIAIDILLIIADIISMLGVMAIYTYCV